MLSPAAGPGRTEPRPFPNLPGQPYDKPVPGLAVILLITAAALHAGWNAVLRSGQDRLWSIVAICGTSAVVALPFALALPAPASASWPFLAASATLQIAYCLFLVRAYRHGGLAQVYPIARGLAPLLVTLGGATLAGDVLSPWGLAGVALIAGGVLSIGLGRGRLDLWSFAAALVTGALVAAYTICDGFGARASARPASYAAWLFIAQGAPMPLIYLVIRRRAPVLPAGETVKALAAGIVGMIAYGLVIWALSIAPMGGVSALRETGIVFALLIGRLFLKEPIPRSRLLACLAIFAGAVLLAARI